MVHRDQHFFAMEPEERLDHLAGQEVTEPRVTVDGRDHEVRDLVTDDHGGLAIEREFALVDPAEGRIPGTEPELLARDLEHTRTRTPRPKDLGGGSVRDV